MNLEITLVRSIDDTVVGEVRTLPGVLASPGNPDPRWALRTVLGLALRVLAERIELGELKTDDLAFNFSLNVSGQMLLAASDLQKQTQESVSSNVREQWAAAVFDPAQDVGGAVQGVVAEALNPPRSQGRRAATVLDALRAAGWREHRSSPSHRTLRRGQGEELIFPFREEDVLRNELLHRVGTLGGVQF